MAYDAHSQSELHGAQHSRVPSPFDQYASCPNSRVNLLLTCPSAASREQQDYRGVELAERELRVEREGHHHQRHHVPLALPHPALLVFPGAVLLARA